MKSGFYTSIAFFIAMYLLVPSKVRGQDIAPQIWNNASLGWNISDQFSLRNSFAYNVLLSQDFPWHEFTFTTTGGYNFHKYLGMSVGLYLATTKQTVDLSSFETRPFLGFRIFSNNEKRFIISNLSRIELRHFNYSDETTDVAGRFRNRTSLAFSFTQRSMISAKNFFGFGYFEAFHNFDKEVKERFFKHFKYKLGLGYRLSSSWIFDFGVIYQDADDNIEEPSHYPTVLTTNYIIEWGVTYIIQ